MPHKFDPQHMQVLESPAMRGDLDPDKVFALLPLAAGQAVADVGCGPGYFTLPLARRVGRGRVYAIDVQDAMLARVRQKLARQRVSNVEVVRSEDSDLRIPRESLDGAFMAFVLHEAEDRGAFLKAVGEALKPGGWIAVIEWHRRAVRARCGEMPEGPPLHERLSPRQVRLALRRAGLAPGEAQDLNEKHYLVLARRP